MLVMGVDPSTKTGLVLYGDGSETGKVITFPKLEGWRRLIAMEAELGWMLDNFTPDRVVIERYFIGRLSSAVLLGQISTIYHRLFHLKNLPVFGVPAMTLKMWTTGSGKADKPAMAQSIAKKWGYKSPSNDILDAYALARMGHLEHQELLSIKGVTYQGPRSM